MLSKFNFLLHLKSKTNLVTLRKCNSHLQYHKNDSSSRIKLQEINLHVCKEYKSEREARDPNRTGRGARRSNISEHEAQRSNRAPKIALEACDENVPEKRADFFNYGGAIILYFR